jgi:hypothetical protein
MYCALFVPDQIVSDPIPRPPQFVVDMQDRSTGIAEDRIDSFVGKRINQDLSSRWSFGNRRNWNLRFDDISD